MDTDLHKDIRQRIDRNAYRWQDRQNSHFLSPADTEIPPPFFLLSAHVGRFGFDIELNKIGKSKTTQ